MIRHAPIHSLPCICSLIAVLAACSADAGAPLQPGSGADAGIADTDPTGPAPDGNGPDDTPTDPTSCSNESTNPISEKWTVDSGGRERSFYVHVPGSAASGPRPVVIDLHGLLLTAGSQMAVSSLPELADEQGFIAIHPQGVGNSWNSGACCGTAQAAGIDDVAFIRDVLDELESRLCIDRDRVFATGISNGGHMAYRLACELSDRIAGIAPVAGAKTLLSCNPQQKVSVLHFHGTADTVVPYSGGVFGQFIAAETTTRDWALANGCDDQTTIIYDQGDARCAAYENCPTGAQVTLCTIDGGGHTWPGGSALIGLGRTSDDISATSMIWQFFTEQTAHIE